MMYFGTHFAAVVKKWREKKTIFITPTLTQTFAPSFFFRSLFFIIEAKSNEVLRKIITRLEIKKEFFSLKRQTNEWISLFTEAATDDGR